MTDQATQSPPAAPSVPERRTIAQAKANLLAWAEESDKPSKSAIPRAALVVGGGVAALVGGLVLSRFLRAKPPAPKAADPATPVGIRVIGLLVAAKVAKWLLPIVLSAVGSQVVPKSQSK